MTLDGATLKNIGTEAALHAFPEWQTRAQEAAVLLLSRQSSITSEDVTDLVGFPRQGRTSNANNAVGAVFLALRTMGLIRRAGFAPARNPQAHNRLLARWTRVEPQ